MKVLAWRVCARWKRGVVILVEAIEVKRRPSEARVCLFYSLSLSYYVIVP